MSVDAQSVSRDSPSLHGRLIEIIEEKRAASAKATASASLDIAHPHASLSSEAGGHVSKSLSKKLELSTSVALMMVTQSKSSDGHYRWLIESTSAGMLEGRPWDAGKQPRLRLIDKRSDPSKGIPPTVRVEVRCRREDLIISDLQMKDESIWTTVKSRVGHKNRMAAAISYIRNRLSEENLEVQNVEDLFGQLTLGSTIAQSS